MGYSFSTPCHSAKHAEQMAEFLREHLRPFKEVCEENEGLAKEAMDAVEKLANRFHPLGFGYDISGEAVCLGDEIHYGPAKSKVGFNTPVGEDARYFMWSLLAWVALTMGRKRQCQSVTRLGIRRPTVYMTYDRETIPVLTVDDLADWPQETWPEAHQRGWVRDPLGVLPAKPTTMEAVREWISFKFVSSSARHEDEDYAKFLLERRWRESALRAVTLAEMTRIDTLWRAQS